MSKTVGGRYQPDLARGSRRGRDSRHGTPRRACPAFSMVETLISIILVGGLLVAVLNTTGAAMLGQQSMADRGVGCLLAQELMTEVFGQAYDEPEDVIAFGTEAGESGGSRADFDDVDDYHGWEASPPQRKDGTEIPDRTGWRRLVTVNYVDPDLLTEPDLDDWGSKRITVTVENNGVLVASLVAVRTSAADEFEPER